ncbi:NAD(P)H-dependent oxidoreductase [Amorphus orientalis]|uniref:FMN reductase n=1 Tax=Amorphus orientalis TaxID=649198 RepID=A0AAE4AR99_9HYPH|nr:NAD(P)H-dependent oxidoreductase [Amorphus orientalis]MDQ0314966.1 FMN reductase [Amorphus orientalis]
MHMEILSGNPSPAGRTSRLALDVGQELASCLDLPAPEEVIELSAYASGLFEWGNATIAELKARLDASRFIVIATPTYKASYTGLLKAFLDTYSAGDLAGHVVVPVFTGGSPAHSLAPDFTLRPLLVELGASVPTPSLYVVSSLLDGENTVAADFVHDNRFTLKGAAHGLRLLEESAA